MKTVRRRFAVPIFEAAVTVVLCDNLLVERRKFDAQYGPYTGGEANALCTYNGGPDFLLLFERGGMTTKTVAHEVFHLTHRILERCSCNFDPSHHEQGALLHGYLMNEITIALNEMTKGKPPAGTA